MSLRDIHMVVTIDPLGLDPSEIRDAIFHGIPEYLGGRQQVLVTNVSVVLVGNEKGLDDLTEENNDE